MGQVRSAAVMALPLEEIFWGSAESVDSELWVVDVQCSTVSEEGLELIIILPEGTIKIRAKMHAIITLERGILHSPVAVPNVWFRFELLNCINF